jgi:hypothetical protein
MWPDNYRRLYICKTNIRITMKQYIPGIIGTGLIVISIVVMVVMRLVIKEATGVMH